MATLVSVHRLRSSAKKLKVPVDPLLSLPSNASSTYSLLLQDKASPSQISAPPSPQSVDEEEKVSLDSPTPPPTPPSKLGPSSEKKCTVRRFVDWDRVRPSRGPKSILKKSVDKGVAPATPETDARTFRWSPEVEAAEQWKDRLDDIRRSRRMLSSTPIIRRPLLATSQGPGTPSRAARISALCDREGRRSSRRRGMREIIGSSAKHSSLTAEQSVRLLVSANVDRVLGWQEIGRCGVRRTILAPDQDVCGDSWLARELFRRAQQERAACVLFKRAYLNAHGNGYDSADEVEEEEEEDGPSDDLGRPALSPGSEERSESWLAQELCRHTRDNSPSLLFQRAYSNGSL